MVDIDDEVLYEFLCIYFTVQGLCCYFMFIKVIMNLASVYPLYRIMNYSKNIGGFH